MDKNSEDRVRIDHLRKGAGVNPYDALIAGSISGALARYVSS